MFFIEKANKRFELTDPRLSTQALIKRSRIWHPNQKVYVVVVNNFLAFWRVKEGRELLHPKSILAGSIPCFNGKGHVGNTFQTDTRKVPSSGLAVLLKLFAVSFESPIDQLGTEFTHIGRLKGLVDLHQK